MSQQPEVMHQLAAMATEETAIEAMVTALVRMHPQPAELSLLYEQEVSARMTEFRAAQASVSYMEQQRIAFARWRTLLDSIARSGPAH